MNVICVFEVVGGGVVEADVGALGVAALAEVVGWDVEEGVCGGIVDGEGDGVVAVVGGAGDGLVVEGEPEFGAVFVGFVAEVDAAEDGFSFCGLGDGVVWEAVEGGAVLGAVPGAVWGGGEVVQIMEEGVEVGGVFGEKGGVGFGLACGVVGG